VQSSKTAPRFYIRQRISDIDLSSSIIFNFRRLNCALKASIYASFILGYIGRCSVILGHALNTRHPTQTSPAVRLKLHTMLPRPRHICQLPVACRRARPSTNPKGQPYSLSVSISQFSACAQQPKFASKKLPKKPQSLRKRINNDESSAATVAEGVPQLDNAQVPVGDDYGLSSISKMYPDIRYDSNEVHWICFDVEQAGRDNWNTEEIELHLKNTCQYKNCIFTVRTTT
jgi:hypothetical protein